MLKSEELNVCFEIVLIGSQIPISVENISILSQLKHKV